jgi:hypothetical protein
MQPTRITLPHTAVYALLTETRTGVLVIFATAAAPRGRRRLAEAVIDAPFHLVADKVHAILARLP